MIRSRSGFMLLEAILTVIIVSICLTFVAQSLLTNFRTGVRFQEMVRSLLVMENRLGLLYATNASEDQLDPFPQTLEAPYDKFTVSARKDAINKHLNKIELRLSCPVGQSQSHLDVTTIIYNPNEN